MTKFRYKPVGRKPRASRAKPQSTRTCPVCAEAFKASRSDQRFCGSTCRTRAHRNSIPSHVEARVEQLTEKRRVTRERAAERRKKDREHRDKRCEEKRLQDEADAPLRAKWIALIEAEMTAQIANDPLEFHEGLRRSMSDQIERARTAPIPRFVRELFGTTT